MITTFLFRNPFHGTLSQRVCAHLFWEESKLKWDSLDVGEGGVEAAPQKLDKEKTEISSATPIFTLSPEGVLEKSDSNTTTIFTLSKDGVLSKPNAEPTRQPEDQTESNVSFPQRYKTLNLEAFDTTFLICLSCAHRNNFWKVARPGCWVTGLPDYII